MNRRPATRRTRTVELRNERFGDDVRRLWAYVDAYGLHIEGQDIGPGTSAVSDDNEYEWHALIAPLDIRRVVLLLDGFPGEDVIDLLDRHWTAEGQSYELERRLRESDIPLRRTVW